MEAPLSLQEELEHFWHSGAPRSGPRMNAYADWWLARARGLEQRDEAPVRELEDAELRELTASLRELSEGSSILLVIQLREAAWELQEELNRRTDLQSATDEQAARGEPSALGSPAAL